MNELTQQLGCIVTCMPEIVYHLQSQTLIALSSQFCQRLYQIQHTPAEAYKFNKIEIKH